MIRSCAALVPALLLTACNVVTGNGTLAIESREVTAFSKVYVADALGATISPGPTTVKVNAEENLLEYLDTMVEDGVLKIGFRDGVWVTPTKPVEIRVYTPDLVLVNASGASKILAEANPGERFELEASGASSIEVSGLDCAELDARASDASSIVVRGVSESLELQLSGASNGCLSALAAGAADVALSGASTAQIVASASVTGDLSGASHLDVDGDPAERSLQLSGESKVEYR